MQASPRFRFPWFAFVCLAQLGVAARGAEPIHFQRDIRPVLSDACFHCHGPDEHTREADLRLDTAEGIATQVETEQADESPILERIHSDDPDLVMPPPESGKRLTDEQKQLISDWVGQGARWERHWSFAPPLRPDLPVTQRTDWIRNPIDAFVLSRLDAAQLQPGSAATRRTLARRVALDLTGIPPTPDELDAFLEDESVDAYPLYVDRLLQSKRYGQRMAMVWLDASRYADTDGFQADATRNNWPWRDWVVDAYNANMPFDQFTVEQFAGDLLPDASADQILATCFHRNHMTNGEGGRHAEESRIDYVIDRVNTTGTVWLGLTLGCAQCHSHKYDPISHREYYELNAFFNSIDEDGRAGGAAKPYLDYQSSQVDAGLAKSQAWLKRKADELQAVEASVSDAYGNWLAQHATRIRESGTHQSWHREKALQLKAVNGAVLVQNTAHEFQASGENALHEDYVMHFRPTRQRITGMRLRVLPAEAGGKLSLEKQGHVILTNLKLSVQNQQDGVLRKVRVDKALADAQKGKSSGGAKEYGSVRDVLDDDPRTGWSTDGSDPTNPRTAVFSFAEPVELAVSEHLIVDLRHRSLRGYSNIRRFVLEFTSEPAPASHSLEETPLEQLAANQGEVATLDKAILDQLREQFFADRPGVLRARERVGKAEKRVDAYVIAAKPVKVMVMQDREEPRETHVLLRGVWDKKGETVASATPAVLSAWPAETPRDRLGLARWLVDRKHPLTARVAINRYWQMYFGYGLVRTPEDFGIQGEAPTHPRLLDWLAVELMESGWDVKHIQRLIVTSATYRQSSACTDELRERDPENRLLARATRFRMPSWMIRDATLASCGLLDDRTGGPSVFPYQPEGAWLASTMGRFRYEPSVGADLYRRSLYSFWRRSVIPTGMFDAAGRLVCQIRSVRTNTPLHALVLMNDGSLVEAATELADHVLANFDSARSRINGMFVKVLSRQASEREMIALLEQLGRTSQHYNANSNEASEFLSVRQDTRATKSLAKPPTLAAYAILATTILNLDEAITRE